MNVLDLLDDIEILVDDAPGLPLTGKIMVDKEELLRIVEEIRTSLPDDVQQARWVKDEKNRILQDAKDEFEKIILEAKKQADYLVETDEITTRAKNKANEIMTEAEENSKMLKMKTYRYVDDILIDMQEKMDDLNLKYFGEMYANLEKSFVSINEVLTANRDQVKEMAFKTQNGQDVDMTQE
ncbi:MAG: ATPase [Clostridia bacterium]|nr:ATPase [Clostridia bacterium]